MLSLPKHGIFRHTVVIRVLDMDKVKATFRRIKRLDCSNEASPITNCS